MTPDELTRFWSRVDKSGDCWLWTGETNNRGYGRFTVWRDGSRSRYLAHRLAVEFAGKPLMPGDVLLHSCDTPACVNPAHLSVGTQTLNMRDAQAKGRTDTSGLFADVQKVCAICGTGFVGSPNRRYCDPHSATPRRERTRLRKAAEQGAAA